MRFVCLVGYYKRTYYRFNTDPIVGVNGWSQLRSHPVLTSRLHFLLLHIKVLVTLLRPLTILCNGRYRRRKVDMSEL